MTTSKNRFLPGFNVAPPANKLRVSSGFLDGLSSAQRKDAFRKHRLFKFIGGTGIKESNTLPERATSWEDLTYQVSAWVNQHLAYSTVPVPINPRKSLPEIAHEGIETSKAFLEVIPRVLFRQEFEEPAKALRQYAECSAGFVSEWAGIANEVDSQLAFALAERKPSDIKTVFKGLRFNPSKFTFDSDKRIIFLHPANAHNLRAVDHVNHPARAQAPADDLFACPAFAIIPHIYRTMLDVADKSDLLLSTYLSERSNHALD